MLLFIGSLGAPEIVFIIFLALMIFGPKKIPEIARTLGKGLREFKQGTSGFMDSLNQEIKQPAPPPSVNPQVEQQTTVNASSEKTEAPKPPVDAEPVVINMEDEDQKA